eukprot:TRINITY_DN29009_c0_g1_i2.p1 TRINITY_DN29009_c0_g1~~TRINITY_DN29009_c0_g1_i2.p1  ORF type:complete len:743 (+),score=185.27 TRINITY_DN29009_c0_g1_i2:163-2229(+)
MMGRPAVVAGFGGIAVPGVVVQQYPGSGGVLRAQPGRAGGALAAGIGLDTLANAENREALESKIKELFRAAAGSDRHLQLHEMQALAARLAASLAIPPDVFGDIGAIFYSYDFSCDGNLNEEEGILLIQGMIRAARDARDPMAAHNFRCRSSQLPFNLLEQRYAVVKKLGQGGQGAVYLATDKSVGKEKVVKLYRKSDANAPVDDIIDEFNLLKSLDHPKIARTYDIFQDQGNIYVVSEPYHGGDLTTLVATAHQNGVAVTEAWLARIFKQVCDGMCFLHSKHTMHCDLKEPNVMVSGKDQLANPNIVLIDFGLASVFTKGAGGVKGTPGYMPPEVWQLGLWTPKGDTFSLGVMFYRMATFGAFSPFGGQTIDEIKMKTLRGALPRPSPFAHKPLFDSLIKRMLTFDFRGRASVKAVSEDPWFRSAIADQAPLDLSALEEAQKVQRTSKLHKALLTDFAQKENLAELQELNEMFMSLDKDNSGTLSAQEVRTGLQGRMPADQIETFVQAMMGSSDKVAYTEFMGQMLAAKQQQCDEILLKIFQEADADNSGTLDANEVSALLQKDAVKALMEGRDPSSIMRAMDQDRSGTVSFDEFSRALVPRHAAAAKQPAYKVGDSVEYLSASHGRWVPCQVTKVHRKGAIQVSVKPDFWFSQSDANYRIRRPNAGAAQAPHAAFGAALFHHAMSS